MAQLLLLLVGVLVVAAIGFGVVVLITSVDPGLAPAEPDGRAVPLPTGRPLIEGDLDTVRFDTVFRGYRMAQVDTALRRAAYDLGYKEELITVLMAEVDALRAGRVDDADLLRQARDQALAAARPAHASAHKPAIVVPDVEAEAARESEEAAEAEPEAKEPSGKPPDWSVELDDSWRQSTRGGR
jgi:DivIVA domain-containing protein